MKILVANLGSTSFKYRLFDLADPSEPVLARGAVERIGAAISPCTVHLPSGPQTREAAVPDHGVAVRMCLEQLTDPATGVLKSADEVAAIGFKAVHAKHLSGVVRVNSEVLEAMEAYADVCPAHNPPYTKAMRLLADKLPEIPLIAAFETDFHQSIPEPAKRYAVPEEWATKFGIKRHGFHGASHRFIATRMAQILGRSDARIISCHLGGSSSLCAISNGKSQGCSLGMSPQSGLPHNNRVGDLDVFALPVVLRETGQSLEQVLHTLANKSGLEGICGLNDLRDIEAAAGQGNAQARLALDLFITDIRRYLGSFLVTLGGADAIVFTGGIGENSKVIREAVCRDLGWFGIELDPAKNLTAKAESQLSVDGSRVQIWTVPTNEELIVARQTRDLLAAAV
ncbi:MAG: acetate/propionate family kinase [Planctomycetota bacterium]|nr:acetate/propionate family kinase [Planctomycetota bacterium]